MKVKRFNESMNDEPEIMVRINFGGSELVPLRDVRETAAYSRNRKGTNEDEAEANAIFYGLEEIIFNHGLGGYSYDIINCAGDVIGVADIEENQELCKNTRKYNV